MILRHKTADPDSVLRLGLVFLILASLGRWFLRPSADFSQGLVDGAIGVLYGVAIGTLVLGLWLARRRGTSRRD
jgi:hypothetical protein